MFIVQRQRNPGNWLKDWYQARSMSWRGLLLLISVGNRCVLQISSKILLTRSIFPPCLECNLLTGFLFKLCLQDKCSFYICMDSASGWSFVLIGNNSFYLHNMENTYDLYGSDISVSRWSVQYFLIHIYFLALSCFFWGGGEGLLCISLSPSSFCVFSIPSHTWCNKPLACRGSIDAFWLSQMVFVC